MDERYQQPPAGQTTYQPQQYVPQPQPIYQPVAAPRPSRANVFVRMLRLLLRRFFYGLTLLGRALAPHKFAIAIALPLLALVAGLAGFLVWERVGQAGPGFSRAASIPPGPEVENFLDAQRSFDADKMWDSFSPELQASLLDKGQTKSTMRAQLQNQKLAGQTFANSAYVGGIKLSEGGAIYFYVVDRRSAQGGTKVPFTFMVDDEGKITGIQ